MTNASRRTRVLIAFSLALAVSLAALAHSHAHAFQQGRYGQTTCLFCQHGVAPGPTPAPIAVPTIEGTVVPLAPAVAPPAVAAIAHPGQGPPRSELSA